MSTNEQTPLSQPTSAVRNTLGREQAPQNLVRLISDEDLREYCDKNYHQILPIIAEKLHQEKLKSVKARLKFEEASQYSESETPNRRRNLKERLGPRDTRTGSGGSEQRRGRSKSSREKGTQKAATKVLALKKQKLLPRNIVTKESILEERKQCQKVKEVQEGTGSQNQRSKSQAWRMTYPNHEVGFDDLPKESTDSYDDLRKAFLENYLQQKKCIKDPVEIYNIKQRNRESTEEFVRRYKLECRDGEMAASNRERKKSFPSWKHEAEQKQNFKRGNFQNEQRMERKQNRFTLLTKIPREILALDKGKFKPPPPMTIPVEKRNASKFCEFHEEISLLVRIGNKEHSTFTRMNFMVVRSPSPYNGIIGRPRVRKIRAIPSTAHEMIKFLVAGRIVTLQSSRIILLECSMVSEPGIPWSAINQVREEKLQVAIHPEHLDQTVTIGSTLTKEGRKELYGLLRCHLDVFAWKPTDMTGVTRHIAEHRLNVRERCLPVRQKKRGQAPERNKAISEEVKKLVEADIMKEFHYHSWLSNPVMVKKHDDSWRMCVDFKDLNKACPKDGYPLPKIDWKVESLCGYPYKFFLDAYKGYHQIKMAEEDEKKTAFITSQGIFCTFLGYKVDADGLRVSSDKVKAVLDLPSPKCLKDAQKLNGKLASLNIFFVEKSLPFFKTLKTCTKKSDFQWTPKAEGAFKEMKQLIAKLSMLTAPKEKEELIMYLAAAKEAISAVLMTEMDGKQVPVYFISRALQGTEINYTPMEKLILALVSVSKRLKRYFQAHTIVVITDQPIKQLLSNPKVTGRMLKWRFELGEHDIQYRPRTSVKGQILADFILERPEDGAPDTPMEDREELPDPWILFTDGSSCVDGSGAGLIIMNPEGMEFTYALRFRFNATINEAEYEALIAGLRIASQMGIQNLQANMDSKLVANQKADALSKTTSTSFTHLSKQVLVEELRENAIDEKEILAAVEEEGYTWMTPVYEYLTEGILLEEKKKARTVRRKAGRYAMINEVLYKKSFLGLWLRCVGPLQANYVLREIHEGSCSMHAGPRFVVAKALRSGYFWPTMHTDARNLIRECKDCQVEEVSHVLWAHRTMIKSSNEETPFSLTYGAEAVIQAEIGMPTLRTAEVDMVKNNEALGISLDILEEKREQVAIQEARNKAKMEVYYNARVQSTSFRLGDFVYQNNEASHAKDGDKLGPKWEGPYEVTEALGKGAYRLRDRNGHTLSRTWNICNLKKCYMHEM
nr:reverse transcriptase domain-containing protein [Tanacetum cinerariifolium]